METIGDRIKFLRKQENLDQNQFCKKIGISERTLRRWENNKFKPKMYRMLKITEIFNVKLQWLMYGE